MSQVTDPGREFGTLEGEGAVEGIQGRTPWQLFYARLRRDKWALAGGIFILFMVFLAIFGAPLASAITGHSVNEKFLYEMTDEFGSPKGPTLSSEVGAFLFGADGLGRDMLVRILYGARASLTVALMATTMELFIGVGLGLVAGFYRGKVDTFISRASDVVLTLPVLLLAAGLASACSGTKEGCMGGLIKPGLPLVAAIIGLFSWPYIFRIIRGQVLSLREKEFVEASRSMGAGGGRIVRSEILPNVVAPIIVYATLIIPTNILFEAALSFLGLGIPASIPSWGRMLDEASGTFVYTPWLMLFPGLFLLATTLAFNLLGDGLRDALDPRSAAALEG